MKRLIVVVMCLCFANVVNAQGERCQYPRNMAHDVKGTVVLSSTGQPVNGVVCTYDGNGKVLSEAFYKDGKPEDITRLYNESKTITYNDNKTTECTYRINGICTTEDIGGVQASKVSIAPSLSEIDRQIAVLNAFLAAPISTPDYGSVMSGFGGFWQPGQVQQAQQSYIQTEQLNRQRYQMLLQELQQERARQTNQQTANETYRLKFENYNYFTVSVIFEVQERGFGAKRTGTLVLGSKETKEITDTFVDPQNVVLITRRLSN